MKGEKKWKTIMTSADTVLAAVAAGSEEGD